MTIREFGESLKMHAPCDKGAEAFSRCKSRKDVFELIGDPSATDFFLKSIADGWGPTPEDIETIFRPYVNGGLTAIHAMGDRKLRSQVWCRSDEVSVPDSVRWLILIGCRGAVKIADWQVVKIFMDANCSVNLECSPNSIVYVENYGGEIRNVKGECKIKKAI